MTALRLGSLFDGIGVFPLAAVRCGIEPVWASEIEKAPISITKRHFPDMVHLGDVTKLDGRDLPPVHTSSVEDIINLVHNLDCYDLHPGVTDDETLGRIYVEDMELLDVPDNVLPYCSMNWCYPTSSLNIVPRLTKRHETAWS